jgi:UrcA family protein
MIRVLPMLLAGLMVSSAALAETPREPTQVHVSIQDVDFTKPADVARLYQRLRTAANEACDSEIDTFSAEMEDRACAAKALNDAVQSAHQPLLLAMHDGDATLKVASNLP